VIHEPYAKKINTIKKEEEFNKEVRALLAWCGTIDTTQLIPANCYLAYFNRAEAPQLLKWRQL